MFGHLPDLHDGPDIPEGHESHDFHPAYCQCHYDRAYVSQECAA